MRIHNSMNKTPYTNGIGTMSWSCYRNDGPTQVWTNGSEVFVVSNSKGVDLEKFYITADGCVMHRTPLVLREL